MKKLLKKIGMLGGVVIALVSLMIVLGAIPQIGPIVDSVTDSVRYYGMGKMETLLLLERAQMPGEQTKIIMGDSVANQLYEKSGDEEHFIMTSNLGMTVVWQYIFAREVLESHPNATDIYLCAIPDVLDLSFDINNSYCYMLVPLAETDNMDVLGEKQVELLQKMYGSVFVKPQVAKFVGENGFNTKLYLHAVKAFYEILLQKKVPEEMDNTDLELTEMYYGKIYELCKEKNVTLHFIPNPKKDTPEDREYMKRLEEQYKKSSLCELNPDFFEQIVYYPEEYFKDEVHFKDGVLKDGGRAEIIKAIQNATGKLENIPKE